MHFKSNIQIEEHMNPDVLTCGGLCFCGRLTHNTVRSDCEHFDRVRQSRLQTRERHFSLVYIFFDGFRVDRVFLRILNPPLAAVRLAAVVLPTDTDTVDGPLRHGQSGRRQRI